MHGGFTRGAMTFSVDRETGGVNVISQHHKKLGDGRSITAVQKTRMTLSER